MVRKVGVIGHPVQHSISPVVQTVAFEYAGLRIEYGIWDTAPEKLEELLEQLRGDPEVIGANVTIPYKETVAQMMDDLEGDAEILGAVNTIVSDEGKLTGYNTDSVGFIQSLKNEREFEFASSRALVLGAGGAAKAVVLGLAREQVGFIGVANRTIERTVELLEIGKGQGVECRAFPLKAEALSGGLDSEPWDLIVNATSVGMRYTISEGARILPGWKIPSHALVCDLVYNPLITPLLKDVKESGGSILPGLSMLVYQGCESFRLWTGMEPRPDLMMLAGEKALES